MDILRLMNKISGGNISDLDSETEFNKVCVGYNFMPTVLPSRDRVIALGDIHGDWQLLLRCLKLAKVINDDFKYDDEKDSKFWIEKEWVDIPNLNLKWTGGNTYVVQVGDQIDRCRPNYFKCDDPKATVDDEASDIKILKFMTYLHTLAIEHKGAVISLLGNHELLNVEGNMNYVSYKGLEEFKKYKKEISNKSEPKTWGAARREAFKRGGLIANFLGCTRLSTVIIGSNLFAHAGILSNTLKSLDIHNQDDLSKINKGIREWLLNKITTENITDIVGSEKVSIFWNRILGSIPPNINSTDEVCERYVQGALQILNIRTQLHMFSDI